MASYLRSAYKLLADSSTKSYAATRVYWYTWASYYCCEQFAFTGLLSYEPYSRKFEDKPALGEYVAAARRDEGCAKDAFATCTQPAALP
jgi:hypothetical protein